MNYLLIYHKEDNDGVVSCAIARDYLLNVVKETVKLTLLGCDYNEMSKVTNNVIDKWFTDYDYVIMMDISLPSAKMKYLYKVFGNNFIWIDHHIAVIKDSFKNKYDGIVGERSTDRSALALTYKFFFDQLDEKWQTSEYPELYNILSAYDSWTYEKYHLDFDYVNIVNTGFTSISNLNPIVIESVVCLCNKSGNTHGIKNAISECYNTGVAITDEDKRRWERTMIDNGDTSFKVNGESTVMIISTGRTSSTMFEYYKDKYNHGLVMKRLNDGSWSIHLYNISKDSTLNCGQYMKDNYNGGGHPGAAGAQISEEIAFKIIKNHQA